MLAIAHAGGALNGEAYTNSLEALDTAYGHGFRWFELDFKWTADGRIGCRHDWKDFGGAAPTLADLKARFAGRFTPADAESLAGWMAAHSDATLVTDVKEDDQLPVLETLGGAGVPQERTVVQLFDPNEDDAVARAGFSRRSIILYRYKGSAHRLEAFLRREADPPTAVGLSLAQARTGLARRLEGLPLWVYTVNRPADVRHLRGMGAEGLFTDRLAPESLGLTATRAVHPVFSYGTLRDEKVQRAVFESGDEPDEAFWATLSRYLAEHAASAASILPAGVRLECDPTGRHAEVSPGTVVWHVANDDRAALGRLGSQLAALANDSAALKAAAVAARTVS